ncbi:hypothetical protein [Aeromonas jandaei]|uniref:hypothetical protein n=1 Tax=Aeromonas jandaei TaxID=650 RepID=UPI003BA13C98
MGGVDPGLMGGKGGGIAEGLLDLEAAGVESALRHLELQAAMFMSGQLDMVIKLPHDGW